MNWDNAKSSTIPTIKTLTSLGAGSLRKVSNLIKIEIFRDFWQIISLFFEGLEEALPDSFNSIFGNFTVSISFCFSCWWNDASTQKWIGVIVFLTMSVVSIICSLIFYCSSSDPDDVNQGLQVKTWSNRGKGYKKRLKILLMILTTLYLPVFRDIVLALSCDIKFYPGPNDCSSSLYIVLTILSIFVLCIFIIPAPIILYRIVVANRPIPSLFDAEGNERIGGYTDGDYRNDLEKDECPYKIIYDGYERNWAHYKVIVMVIKIILVLPVVLFVNTNQIGDRNALDGKDTDKQLLGIQSACTIVVLLGYSILSTWSRPFIKNTDDQIDIIARYTALIIAILGCVASQISGGEIVFGVLLNIATFVGGIIIIFYVLCGFKFVQKIVKQMTQRITFTLTRDTNEALIFSTKLDIERERKFRIWHEFWDTLFKQDENLRVPNLKTNDDNDSRESYEAKILGYQYGGSPPYLLDFDGTVGERHEENKEIVENESFESYKSFLNHIINTNQLQVISSMKYIMNNLNGLDVFWNGECIDLCQQNDKLCAVQQMENKSLTFFGKMYIIPYPFCAIFLSDDGDEASTALFSISPVVAGKVFDINKGIENLNNLVIANKNEDIQRRKAIRLKLRALEESMCHWPIQKYKTKTISRTVTVTIRNSENKTETREKTESKSVQVLFSFNDCRFGINRNGIKSEWNGIDVTRGFQTYLQYNDGTGSHTEAEWGNHNWNHEAITVYGQDFGLNDKFEETPVLARFLGQNYREDVHEEKRKEICSDFKRYSQFYINQFIEKEKVLSYAFWYYIYNNDNVTKEELKQMLQFEQNEKLKNLVDNNEYIESINMIYDKLNFFNTNKKYAFWYIFFHDLWMNNMLMKPFITNQEFLSPFSANSICYKSQYIENKDDLIKQLSEIGLHSKETAIRKGWINTTIIDLLYEKLNQFNDDPQNQQQQIQINPRPSTTVSLHNNINIIQQYEIASKIISTICDCDQTQ